MESESREEAIGVLLREGCSCVIVVGGAMHRCYGRGVSDLYRILTGEPALLRGAFVADKVVGKGAAALMVLGGVSELHAEVLSVPAREILRSGGVAYTCRLEVPNIINRAGTGICPVESACSDCRTAEECLPKIENFLKTAARPEVTPRGFEKPAPKV